MHRPSGAGRIVLAAGGFASILTTDMTLQGQIRLAGGAVFLLALAILAGSGTYIVQPGYRGVRVTLGNVAARFLPEGFGIKAPFVSEVVPISIKQRTAMMIAPVISKDLQEVRTGLKVLYRIPEEAVVQIYHQFKGDPFISLIGPRVDEAIKEVTKEHTAQEIVQERAAIKARTLESARRKVGELLVIVDIVLVDISLSEKLEAAIERKMVQEQEANKAVFEQQKAQIDADIEVIRAKGDAESIRVRGEALSLNPEVIDLEVIKIWNGSTPRVVGGEVGGTDMLLPLGAKRDWRERSSARAPKP